MPISAIKPRDVLAALRKVEARGAIALERQAFGLDVTAANTNTSIDAVILRVHEKCGEGR